MRMGQTASAGKHLTFHRPPRWIFLIIADNLKETLLRAALEADPKNDVAQFHLGTLLYRYAAARGDYSYV